MPVKKPALGRGLDALFGPSTATVAEPEPPPVQPPAPPAAPANPELSQASITGGPRQLPIEHITPNPFQPRQDFDPEKLADLVASIREKGILQPLIVRGVKDGHFQIVAGERRWRAAQQAGLRQVPVVIRDFNDLEMTQAAIIENIQRDDLNPIEEARAYETLSNQFGQTQETIAQAVGKSRVAVTNALRLLKLPAEVIEMIQRDILTPGQA
ncbi:ParB/RepB/Spo0J family partition protein, partial [Candidatus Sumerlaeota bacterium]|nr:ParB/RepB/Spo0J family partition protein [Candidatus Sumerlaeota bacterium]